MSFIDRDRRASPASIAAVVAVHVVIGYAVITGLAIRVISHGPDVTIAQNYRDDVPPPPPVRELPPPPPRASSAAQALSTPDEIVSVPLQSMTNAPGAVAAFPPQLGAVDALPAQQAKPEPSLAQGASVIGNRAAWVTTEDYPAAALRAGAEGITAITVMVGTDGRASACRVTASSGNAALDEAACRTYLRRARFRPALDEGGHPIAIQRADRIRWQMPVE